MRYFIPLIIFLSLVAFFCRGLKIDPHYIPSALMNKPLPQFNRPSLLNSNQRITSNIFLGKISLIHVWATWCVTCRSEHPILMDIARSNKISLYGLNYKDNPMEAKRWLEKYGNPYQEIILDDQGTLAIDLGVYGTPETFLIDQQGKIRYKHIGSITTEVWEQEILPKVENMTDVL